MEQSGVQAQPATASMAHGQAAAHPRRLGWYGTTAIAMGGSNQSLFLIAALFAGQGAAAGLAKWDRARLERPPGWVAPPSAAH